MFSLRSGSRSNQWLKQQWRGLTGSNSVLKATEISGQLHASTNKVRLMTIAELEQLHGKDRLWLHTRDLTTNASNASSSPIVSVPLALVSGLVTFAGLYWISSPPDGFYQTEKDKLKHLPADLSSLPVVKRLNRIQKEVQDAAATVSESDMHIEEVLSADQHPISTAKEASDNQAHQHVATEESTLPHPTASAPNASKADAPSTVDPTKSIIKAKYVIVGGGTASYAAMKAVQERESDADILVITAEQSVPYMRPPLSKELWHSEDKQVSKTLKFRDWGGAERDLFYDPPSSYTVIQDPSVDSVEEETKKPKLLLGQKVKSMDVESQVLTLESGVRVKYSRVLLASGGKPKQLPLLKDAPEAVQKRFSTFRTLQDFQELESLVASGKKILIIGGGFLGSELACSVAHRGSEYKTQVTQLFPESGNMALVFPKYLVEWTTERVRKLGVDIRPNVKIESAELPDPDGKLLVKLSDGSSVNTDHVVTCIGIKPNTEYIDSSLEIDSKWNGVVVNAELEARTNVWAAGDVCSFHDIKLGRRRIEHYDHAVLSGRVAGRNMTGAHKPYKHQSFFWSDLGPEIGYEAVGILDASLETVGIWAKATEKDTPKVSANTLDKKLELSGITDSSEKTPSEQQSAADQGSKVAIPAEEHLAEKLKEDYGKGVVFYVRNEQIVGVLLWNMFNRTATARRVISESRSAKDVQELARLFKIHD